MSLPERLNRWRPIFEFAADYYFEKGEFDAMDLAAICDRESRGGEALRPQGPGGTGDGGHGRGLMQIDDRWHKDFICSGLWSKPEFNIFYAAGLLLQNWNIFEDRPAAIAAYNCGPGNVRKALKAGLDVDAYTTGKNYSKDVLSRGDRFRMGLHVP